MYKIYSNHIPVALLTLSLAACSSNNDVESTNETSEFSDQAQELTNTGEPGGDITAIAGLWDGSNTVGEVTDVIYWDMAANGVLTRFDYQQDGVADASGDNCYIIGDPITVSPEDNDTYSIFNVAVSAVRTEQSLTITFLDADINDLDADGDITETPTFSWAFLTSPVLDDLNGCTTETGGSDAPQENPQLAGDDGNNPEGDLPTNNTADRPLMTRAQCQAAGGTVIGDIGDGAIHEPDYMCPSGLAPIARITFLEGEPIAAEGEVCCPS